MSKINYFFEDTTSYCEILPSKSWIENSIEMEGRNLGCINFIICSDNYLVKINKKYLNKEYLTDVITFNTNHLADFESKDYIYGDIYISIERVLENKLWRITFKRTTQSLNTRGTPPVRLRRQNSI